MKTFVIFDRNTGDILRTHVQADDFYNDPEEILKTARPKAEDDVDIMEVEDLAPDANYRVDVDEKKLMPVDASETRGAGGAFVQHADGDPHRARTVVFPVKRTGEKK